MHGPGDNCDCRKPAPGLIIRAAAALGVDPADCAVVGDIGADVAAARSAGARAVLVPTGATLQAEQQGVLVAATLPEAVEALLTGCRLRCWPTMAGQGSDNRADERSAGGLVEKFRTHTGARVKRGAARQGAGSPPQPLAPPAGAGVAPTAGRPPRRRRRPPTAGPWVS